MSSWSAYKKNPKGDIYNKHLLLNLGYMSQ